jgi:hypothetical protein
MAASVLERAAEGAGAMGAMTGRSERAWREDAATAVLVLQPFTALLAALALAAPPDAAERAAADPLVQLVAALGGGTWAVPLASAAAAVAVWCRMRPSRAALARAARLGAGGVLAAAAGVLALRALLGPALPAFVPPEESARPGLLLGLSAGVLEELVVRLGVLPALLAALRWRGTPDARFVAAAASSGVVFALLHEIGPGAGSFDGAHFVVRAAIPGALFSLLGARTGFAFIVAAHAGAHLLIPFCFE